MKIFLNGKEIELQNNSTVQNLVESLNFKNNFFVVEKNQEIVQKNEYINNVLNEGDKIEIVNFVGGG